MQAVGYARLSDKDSSSNSIKSQCRRIEEYCAFNKLELLKIFIDDGKSGWTFDRPGFVELEKFCKQNRSVQFLVIPHFDRFSRTDPVDAMVKERYFRDKLNVKVLQVSEPMDMDTNNPTYLIVRFMQAFAANEERNRIVDRVITGQRYSLSQGRYCSNAPIGYKNSRDENGKPLLKIDDEKAPIIKFIFKSFLRGVSIEETRRQAKLKGFTQGGKMAMHRILSNPVYAGLVNVPAYKNQPAKVVKGVHAPIISENDYWTVQEKLNAKTYKAQVREEVPLRGVLKCECGRRLTAAPSRSKTGKYYWYYFCEVHKKNFSAVKLHKLWDDILVALSMSEKDAAKLKTWLTDEIQKFINEKTKELMKVGLAVQKAERAIEAIEEKFLLQPDISQATYNKVIKEKRFQLNELQAQQAALNVDAHVYMERLNTIMSKITDLKARWDSYDLPSKHNFILQGFGPNLIYAEGEYRTPFLHPLLKANKLKLKELGLVIETKKPSEEGSILEGGAEGDRTPVQTYLP